MFVRASPDLFVSHMPEPFLVALLNALIAFSLTHTPQSFHSNVFSLHTLAGRHLFFVIIPYANHLAFLYKP